MKRNMTSSNNEDLFRPKKKNRITKNIETNIPQLKSIRSISGRNNLFDNFDRQGFFLMTPLGLSEKHLYKRQKKNKKTKIRSSKATLLSKVIQQTKNKPLLKRCHKQL